MATTTPRFVYLLDGHVECSHLRHDLSLTREGIARDKQGLYE